MAATDATTYELFTSTSAEELLERGTQAESRFRRLARDVPADLQLAGSAWTVRDVVAHLVTVARRYTRRDPDSTDGLGETPREVDRINAEELAALGDASRDELLTELEAELETLRIMYPPEQLDLHRTFPFHGGVCIDAAAAQSNLIGEFTIHGRDIAQAAHRPWQIEPRDAVLVLNGVMQILPAYVNRSATSSLSIALRVPGANPWKLQFHDGTLTSTARNDDKPFDVVLRVPPVTLMLALYQRLTPLQAMRGGMLVVGGRKPWRIANLTKLLEQP